MMRPIGVEKAARTMQGICQSIFVHPLLAMKAGRRLDVRCTIQTGLLHIHGALYERLR